MADAGIRPFTSQRHLFDVPADVAYFNCAYYGPQLNETRSRLHAGVESKSHPWERTSEDFFRDAETVRRLASAAFGGDADGYAVIPAASYGASTAARAIEPQLRRGHGILVMEDEFPSNYMPWKRAAQESGAHLVTVSAPLDGDWTAAILARIEPGIAVAALSATHWSNGAFIDLEAAGAACRDVGAVLAVDATQSLGAMPLSIEKVKPDFLFAAGYKWLLCPYGFGLLYVAERWRAARPLEEVWLDRDNARDFTSLATYSDTYMAGARRFDAGEKCTPTILPGAIAALEQIGAWGVETIADELSRINRTIAAHVERRGLQVFEERYRSPHILGATLPERYDGNLVSELAQRKIYVSRRGNAVRFAPHLHVTSEDVDRLLQALDEIVPSSP